jgi:hypothetical protein
MKTLLPAQLTNISSKADRTWKLQFATRELSGSEAAHLTEMILNEGWLLFAPNETDIAETDVPKEQADSMTDGKTPSQRLRGVIYVYWEQKGKRVLLKISIAQS